METHILITSRTGLSEAVLPIGHVLVKKTLTGTCYISTTFGLEWVISEEEYGKLKKRLLENGKQYTRRSLGLPRLA